MRKSLWIIVVTIAVLAAAVLFGESRLRGGGLELKAYFQDAQGLHAGAPVRLAGVDIGTVTSVRARPEIPQSPAEVVMKISTNYDLKIPSDSTVSIATAGVLGEPFAEIEVQGATGSPASSGATLKSRHTEAVGSKELVETISKAIKPCGEKSGTEAKDAPNPPKNK